jgi:multidrug transporter EmrE-like cation transporter
MLRYLLMAVASSALMAGGLMTMKARASRLPVAQGLRIPAALLAWIMDPVWSVGLFSQAIGFALYILSIAHLPISVVAIMMQGGIAMFVMFSVIVLGERGTPYEWSGIGAVIAAIAMLSMSLGAGAESGAINKVAIAAIAIGATAIAAAAHAYPAMRQAGIAAAVSSGLAFGLGSLFAKAMTDTLSGGFDLPTVVAASGNVYVWVVITTNLAGLVMLQNSFHSARGIIALPISSALSNLVPIIGGVIAFGEHLPANPQAAAMRIASFALTVLASAMLSRVQSVDTAGSPHAA